MELKMKEANLGPLCFKSVTWVWDPLSHVFSISLTELLDAQNTYWCFSIQTFV